MPATQKIEDGNGSSGDFPVRLLGRTGERVSIIGLGGSHIGTPRLTDAEAVKIMRSALDRGLRFMDNSWDYHEGNGEIRLGKALLDGYRSKAFVMTKLDGRTKAEANKQLEQSLKRLQVDHIDLLQHHEVIRFDDADRIFSPGGAMEAFIEAKQAGKIRFIGFTGHKDPQVHLYMLEVARRHGFRFDTVQMPLNLMDVHFRSFEKYVMPVLVSEGIGVLGMKSMGSGVILKSNTATPVQCLQYALTLPTSVVITGIDSMEILDQAIHTARTFKPLTESQIASLRAATAKSAGRGEYELFKTTSGFDSTAHHPEWLGEESPRTQQLVTD